MWKRKRLRVLAGVAVVLAAGTGYLLWPRTDRITQENFGRVHAGMSRREVEAVLGKPGDYRSGRTSHDPPWIKAAVGEPLEWVQWEGDAGAALVGYDSSGSVRKELFLAATPLKLTPLDRLGWRIGQLLERWIPDINED
jgi:hypothetical protein